MTDDSISSKRCSKCGEIKPLEDFSKDKRKEDNRQAKCKACYAEYQRERRTANPEENRRYVQSWREANPDKAREKARNYRHAHLQERREADRKRYAANPEKFRQSSQAYRKANPEKVRACKRKWQAANLRPRSEAQREKHRQFMREAYRANPHRWPKNMERRREYSRRYRQLNLEHLKEYLRNWQKTHPEHNRARCHRRRARIKGNGGVFTVKELTAMRIAQAGICAYCREQHNSYALTIDHIIPIDQGGRHEAANICLACKKCNSSKWARTPEQWTNRWYYFKDK
jgi:5-methylcytosine-specific restriction endonuclease McrA